MEDFAPLARLGLFRESLAEHRAALRDFWAKAGLVLAGSGVRLRPLPRSWAGLNRNRFSVLFVAVYHLLDIPPARRALYARVNHCLRAWVTACDNLLDDELKEMLLTDLPPGAAVFKSAHTLLVADRVFFLVLREAEAAGVLTAAQAGRLLATSLAALTASGRQEAEEEDRAGRRLPPARVEREVHGRKAGALFTACLAAPAELGDARPGPRLDAVERGLHHLGLGVQILDDVNDLGDDLARRRQNYLASLALHGDDPAERRLLDGLDGGGAAVAANAALWRRFPGAAARAGAASLAHFERGIDLLVEAGLPLGRAGRAALVAGFAAVARNPPLAQRLRAR